MQTEMNNRRLRVLTYLVIAYMLMAFAWWSVLLYTKNQDAFQAKRELLRIGMVAEGTYQDEAQFLQHPTYLQLAKKYRRQEWMILGEALVFIVTLVLGIFIINRGYRQVVAVEQQRRNFLLSITHELKSPIASIKLILETFVKRSLTPPQITQFSTNAIKEADRLHALVNNLLLAARIEHNYTPIREPLDLTALTGEVVRTLQLQHPEVQFAAALPTQSLIIAADKLDITSVLLNLLENAIKYTKARPIELAIQLLPTDTRVLLRIADNGIGIPDKEKPKIFQRFYRVGNEDTRSAKGTGLGLYIVQQILKAYQGTIVVKDNTPHGAIFEVLLPLARSA